MHLLFGGHLDLPVALGLVGVVLGVVRGLDGHLVQWCIQIRKGVQRLAIPIFSAKNKNALQSNRSLLSEGISWTSSSNWLPLIFLFGI